MDVEKFIEDNRNEITFDKNVEMIIISYERMQESHKSHKVCNDIGVKTGKDDNNHNTILHAIALTPFNDVFVGYEELDRLGFKIHRNGKQYSKVINVLRNNVDTSKLVKSNLYNQKEHIKFLLECGANPRKQNKSGETACTSIITTGEGVWDAMGCPRTFFGKKNHKAAKGATGGSRARHYKKSNPRSHTRRRRRA